MTVVDATFEVDLRARRAALDRLGPASDLSELYWRLKIHDIEISLDQMLRVEHLLTLRAQSGPDLAGANAISNLLCPLLATTAAEQRIIRDEIGEWIGDKPTTAKATIGETLEAYAREGRGVRRVKYTVIAVIAAMVLIGAGYFAEEIREFFAPVEIEKEKGSGGPVDPTDPTPTPTPGDPGPPVDQPAPKPKEDLKWTYKTANDPTDEITLDAIARLVLPGAMLLAPFIMACFMLLPQRTRGAALRRGSGGGERFDRLRVPAEEDAIFRTRTARLAGQALKAPELLRGRRLDARASIDATIKKGGAPDPRFRLESRSHEYMIFAECGGGADHSRLVIEGLTQRLAANDTPFVRYDMDVGAQSVRHREGRRSGPPVEAVATVLRRHAGARLILIGSGASLARRFSAQSADFARVLSSFERPIILNTTPRAKWGRRESWLIAQGVANFPADDKGLAAAARYLSGPAEEIGVFNAASIDPGEDALIAKMEREATRLVSNVAPAPQSVALLVRQLRSFVGGGANFRLLTAIAMFPRIDPSITRFLAIRITGGQLQAGLASRLSQLPWLQQGRMPDWLRLALLRAMTETERSDLREQLMLTLEAFHATQNNQDHHDLEIDILRKPGVRNRLLTSLGLGGAVVHGEGVFLRFLDGDDLDELDQPMERIRPPLTVTRACLIGAVGLTGVIAASLIPLQANIALLAENGQVLRRQVMRELGEGAVILPPMIGYLLLSLILCIRCSQISEFRFAQSLVGRRGKIATWALHLLTIMSWCLFCGVILSSRRESSESLFLIVLTLIPLAAVALHFRLDRNEAPLRAAPGPDILRLGYLTGPLVFMIFATAAMSPLLGHLYEVGAIEDAEPRMFFAQALVGVIMLTVVDLLLRPPTHGQRQIVTILDRFCLSTLILPCGMIIAALGALIFLLLVTTVSDSEPLAASVLGYAIGAAPLIALTLATDLRFLKPVLAFTILYVAAVLAFGPWGDDRALSPEYFLLTIPLISLSYFAIPYADRRLMLEEPANG